MEKILEDASIEEPIKKVTVVESPKKMSPKAKNEDISL